LYSGDKLMTKIEPEAWAIGEAFLKAILLEVSSHPKPGLVSAVSMGSHKDMNILTFMVSSASMAPIFYLCAQAGREHQGELVNLLPVLREIGVWGEKKLLESTKGVNTQKGILFAAGILCGAAGYLSNKINTPKSEDLFEAVSQLTSGIVFRELINLNKNKDKLTAGEQLFLKYQATGIRGEVEAGFPSVKKLGLPAFFTAIGKGVSLNYCLIHTLISLMTDVEDTTILWRKNDKVLIDVKSQAKEILKQGSVFTKTGLDLILELDRRFVRDNISPGGSADLLSITIGTYLLEHKQFPVAIL